MDKTTWNILLTAAPPLILILALYSLAVARPRTQVLVPFLPSLIASIVIYRSAGGDASSFHTAFTICTSLALAFATLLILVRPELNRLATFSWAMLGVVTPYSVVIVLLIVACWNQTDCLG